MENLRLRPANDYINNASWEELHVLTDKWKSDLEFYNFELNFLHKLIDKYYIWLTNDELVNEVEKAAIRLSIADKSREVLNIKTTQHLRHIEEILENEFIYDAQVFRTEHEQLENRIAEFCKNFKLLKKDVFLLTEQVLETENLVDFI